MVAIHIPYASLELRAGQQALSHIRQKGLKPLDVGIIPGAAGGPKGLGLQGLDLALFGHWFNQQPREANDRRRPERLGEPAQHQWNNECANNRYPPQ